MHHKENSHATQFGLAGQNLRLAVGSLILAGCFSLLLIFGRLPVVSELIADPKFFKRCLVLHVDLALIVWFFAFAAGLFALLPGSARANRSYVFGARLALVGVLTMIGGTMLPRTEPVLANYVPVIDNRVYLGGLALFFAGLCACFLNGRLFARADEPILARTRFGELRIGLDAMTALKTCAAAFVTAALCFVAAGITTPRDLPAEVYYELLFWGGGHVLQVANVAAMLAAWLILLGSVLGQDILSRRAARWLFAALLAPHLVSPFLALAGSTTSAYRIGATRLMQFGIFPVVLIVLGVCVARLAAKRAWSFRDIRLSGLAMSVALTLCGFVLGACIRGSNTMIPAHYHAAIGAVTAAFMTLTYLLLEPLGFAAPEGRLRRALPWQVACFGGGQVIFAIGFGFAGLHGLGRKAYGAEQHVRTLAEHVGLGVMGLGGLLAVAGGLLYLFIVIWAGSRQIPPIRRALPLKPATQPTI